ncbi:hypothetical protein V8B97DRAFT_2025637 [Scleroderma yunnanense]
MDYHASFMMVDGHLDNGQVLSLEGGHNKLGHILNIYHGSRKVFGRGQTFLDLFQLDKNLYYPFTNLGDGEIANFLLTSQLSMRAIDQWLSFPLMSSYPISFSTIKELHSHAEILPSGLHWNAHVIATTHLMRSPVTLYYQDLLDCMESLFNCPLFMGKMDYSPYQLYSGSKNCLHVCMVFMEWMSSDGTWELQVSLLSQIPEDGTLCSMIILSSDKTHITNICDGKVAHPLLVSLANIHMDLRNKGLSHVFLAHLFHQCLGIILEPLKCAAHLGQMMSDPVGNLHYCFRPLVSYIVDISKACILALVTMAMYMEFGDPDCHAPHTAVVTLTQLNSIQCESNNVEEYFAACRPISDHDLQWCKHTLGAQELDFWLSVLCSITGLHCFSDSITKLKQVGGHMQRDA